MDLNPYKGLWDGNSSKIIGPTYQEIIFDSEKTTPFNLTVVLNKSDPIKDYFNITWSTTIDALTYKQNENYGAIIKLYYKGQNGTTIEKCICLLYTSPSPRDGLLSRMPSSA